MSKENQKRGIAARASAEAAMTLMEIMIVLAILALVMGFLFGPKIIKQFGSAKEKTGKLMAQDYQSAHTMWSADNPSESCPDSLDDLAEYRNKKDNKDPWGNEFQMVCGDDAPDGVDFGVISNGPNGKAGDKDDINSWD